LRRKSYQLEGHRVAAEHRLARGRQALGDRPPLHPELGPERPRRVARDEPYRHGGDDEEDRDGSELSTYEALGDPRWKGRLCLRTSASPYNQLLLGAWIRRYGEKKVEQVVKGWLANSPLILEKDLYVLKAIAAGKCDVGIAHSYYLARLLVNDPNFPVAPFWPDQQGAGVHVGVAGAGVTAHGRNRADAIKLLEFLTSAENQNAVVDANFEFPVNPNVTPHPVLAKWGPFKLDEVGVAGAADLQAAGGKLAERVGFK
jgi:iron(III) transport system substrate-binding protein